MTTGRIHLAVPGSVRRRSGGTIYDARLLRGLEGAGRRVVLHELPGRFPLADATARRVMADAVAETDADDILVVDGLALAALEEGAAEAEWTARAPLVLLCHMPLSEARDLAPREREALARVEAQWMQRAARVVVPSRHVADLLVESGAEPGRIGVVEPGTDPVAETHRVRGDNTGPVRLLSVGAMTRLKGHRFLVRALAGLKALSWRLTLVGSTAVEPATHRALRTELRVLGLSRRVRITGEVAPSEVHSCYRRADVFVLPSMFESYGMALAEAAAHGLPLVASRAGAVPSTPAGSAARLVSPGDAAALAEALAPLIRSAAARETGAARARAAARRLPTWDDAVRRFLAELDAARAVA